MSRTHPSDDPHWRVKALAGRDPLSAEAFRIRRQPRTRAEQQLIDVEFAILELRLMFDDMAVSADACGPQPENEKQREPAGAHAAHSTTQINLEGRRNGGAEYPSR